MHHSLSIPPYVVLLTGDSPLRHTQIPAHSSKGILKGAFPIGFHHTRLAEGRFRLTVFVIAFPGYFILLLL